MCGKFLLVPNLLDIKRDRVVGYLWKISSIFYLERICSLGEGGGMRPRLRNNEGLKSELPISQQQQKISIYQIDSFFVNISQVGKYECSTALYTYTNWQTSIWKEANDMLSPNVNDTDLEAMSLQCKYDISNSSNNNKDKANDWRQEREVTQPFCKALVAKTWINKWCLIILENTTNRSLNRRIVLKVKCEQMYDSDILVIARVHLIEPSTTGAH